MATIREYRVCDICGGKLSQTISEERNFRIEPKSKIKMAIIKYWGTDPYDPFWADGIDMCSDCWEQMKIWIKVNKGR